MPLKRTLREESGLNKLLRFLNLDARAMDFSHPVWICCPDPMWAVLVASKAQLLMGRYPLTVHKCTGKKQLLLYPLCNASPEIITQLDCPLLQEFWEPYLHKLQQIHPQVYNRWHNKEDITTYRDDDTALMLEGVTQRLCYTLYNHWSIQLGTGSTTNRALRQVAVHGFSQNRKQVIQTVPKLSSNYPVDGVLLRERRNILKKWSD